MTYDIKDAVILKECMKQISQIRTKYPNMWLDASIEENLKESVEFIESMVGSQS